MKRIVVLMSGGVDSSVAAALLVEQGHRVTGVFIEAYNEPGCRTDQDRKDAVKVASKLGISFEVLDLKKEYKKRVVEYFFDEYRVGRTPNPDVMCNSEIKFGLFLDWALAKGYEKVATGHYARIAENGLLQRAVDVGKDQSYFLWKVNKEKLAHVLFPLGSMKKEAVRARARELGLANSEKPDSMGVCMMGEIETVSKLREELGERPGEVVLGERVVGEHRGLWFSTVGQRVGKEISLDRKALIALGLDTSKMPALYVVGKDEPTKTIVIGERRAGEVTLVKLGQVAKYGEETGEKTYLRVRNLGKLHLIDSLKESDEGWEISLAESVWGVARGQSGVVYDEEGRIIGGGIFV